MELKRGETWIFDCIITDMDKQLVDLSAVDIHAAIKHNTKAFLLGAEKDAGITITGTGKCTIMFSDTLDFPTGAAKGEVYIKDADDIIQITKQFDCTITEPLSLP